MKNKKLLAVLTVVALFVWAYNFYQVRSRLTGGASHEKVNELSHEGFTIQGTVKDYDPTVRDPFKPPIVTVVSVKKEVKKENKPPAVVEPPPFTINGIMWDPKNPSVMLQDNRNQETQTLEKGVVWGDLTIISITQSSVKVKYKGKEFEIK